MSRGLGRVQLDLIRELAELPPDKGEASIDLAWAVAEGDIESCHASASRALKILIKKELVQCGRPASKRKSWADYYENELWGTCDVPLPPRRRRIYWLTEKGRELAAHLFALEGELIREART